MRGTILVVDVDVVVQKRERERHDKAHKIDVIYHVRWKIKGP
jgi:hypothetical protein